MGLKQNSNRKFFKLNRQNGVLNQGAVPVSISKNINSIGKFYLCFFCAQNK